ncbi:ABC transporter permease [Oceanotoga sp. DSM 15011]|jgi:simple sugar transport system permease protein|uniref:Nucleoside ABC transporter membrane protein n=1 Tax=Oceanotoga teriensis TaxID=515440 RepID=A0AA45C8W8_9BACT|nr:MULTISPECIES: ABC transporter permease [Oceanotoga]MDN5342063.1 ral nucleoside transport system permease protein [Oceanotoga sp.]MDO7975467.1 ABC transporter permease [Oceanotoga teriensis]PWJ96245.1 nucleoside ABC transporter membrane protein [Oceanotoga teriensis]UYP00029.1 ABC transporter permease [Oceanotoga sp. DSM 15011]
MPKVQSKNKWMPFLVPFFSVLVSLIIAAIIILLLGKNPLTAYAEMFKGAFGSRLSWADNITKMTSLLLTGLAVGFGFRAGVFNIGAEGQMAVGGIMATFVGINMGNVPAVIAIPLTMMAGILGGAVWASIAGILKAKTGAHEVISTIMLNWVAYHLSNYVVSGPLAVGQGVPKSPEIAQSAQLPPLLTVQASNVPSGILVAIVAAFVVYIVLQKTTVGYELKAVGYNPYAAEYGGISISKNIVLTMAISGGLAGLAGAIEVMCVYHRIFGAFTGSRGFDGITIALIGQNNPIGIIFSSFLISSLRSGSNAMQSVGIPDDIVTIIQGIIIFFVAANRIIKMWIMKFSKPVKGGELE